MTSKKDVDDFLDKKNIAVVGVSRKKGNFGNTIFNELKKKGYNTFAVNPSMEQFEGEKCYARLDDLKDQIDSVITVIPGNKTEAVVKEAHQIGVKHIWMQQGSESEKAIEYCRDHGIHAIFNECIFMFLEPVKSIHGFHR